MQAKPSLERRSTRSAAVVVLTALVLASASCASVSSTSTPYVGAPHPQPSDPNAVQILRQEPTRPHARLGEIVVDAWTDPAPPIAKVEDKLRAEAGKLGADAVVVVYDQVQPVGAYVAGPWWGRNIETITGHRLVGVAIRYQQ